MLSLFFRNLFFTLLQPGMVAGVIPYWIAGCNDCFKFPWRFGRYAGVLVWLTGLVIMLWCITGFALRGRGTLSPVDPTRKLVIHGLYRFSRNPMYVGVMLILIGEALFSQSMNLWVYLIVIFVAFNAFVIWREEPRLTRDFGNEYVEYRKQVRRWL